MKTNDKNINQLRLAVEQAVGRKMYSPKDFDFLSEAIYEKLHQNISTSTLKRVWGYVQQYATIRCSTLNLLSQYVGYDDWEHFCSTACGETDCEAGRNTEEEEKKKEKDMVVPASSTARWKWLAAVAAGCLSVLVAVVGGSEYWQKNADSIEDGYILKAGQRFSSPGDYLKRFGIAADDSNYWDRPLPHHPQVFIWSPQYHHPVWHNDGNPDSLMPTITEYWHPADTTVSKQTMAEHNRNHYFNMTRTNELRITFMKNLVDTNFVFLGVYRVKLDGTDASHVVWERMSEVCDLRHLDYLEQLRN